MTLKDAIDRDEFRIDNCAYTDEQIKAMTTEELELLKTLILKRMSGISAVLREKKMDYRKGGKGSTPEWFLSRKSALSINQRVLTYVSGIIKSRRRIERNLGDFFMDKAKLFLPHEEYETILKSAQREMAARGDL